MDNRSQRQRQAQRQAERQKYRQRQMYIRIGAILLALVLSIAALAQSCSTKKAVEDLAAQLQAKKAAQAQEALLAAQQAAQEAEEAQAAAQEAETPVPADPRITLSFIGECTLGIDNNDAEGGYVLQEYYDSYGASYFFQNVRSIFEGDDLTTASLVGSLTTTENRQNWNSAYRAENAYAEILTSGGVDAVTLANDHIYDFGDEGYVDTLANLDVAGLGRFGLDGMLTEEIYVGASPAAPAADTDDAEAEEDPEDPEPSDTVLVGFTGVWQGSDRDYETMAVNNIETLRDRGADIVVAEVSWSSAEEDMPDDSQILTAHKLIDSGADLVVGIQPYVLQGIELYHGKYIVYSLGSFLTADPEPQSVDTMIFQQTFTLKNGQVQPEAEFEIIPCTLSADAGSNTCCPTPATGAAAEAITDRIYRLSGEMDGGIQR